MEPRWRAGGVTVELRLLGPVDLRDGAGNSLHSVLSQTKRMAFLAYVGASRTWVRRSQLLGLFWSDLPEERARHALSQSLYHLRRRLGDQVLVTRGDHELGLDPAHIRCDVVRFHDALERDAPAVAAEAYRGDFMEGFHLPDGRAFNDWMARTRNELRASAAWACLTAASKADPTTDTVTVVRMSWRATRLAPFDESLQRAAAHRLLAAGDRGAAALVCEQLIERLTRELQVEPDPETRALLRSLRVSPSGRDTDAVAGDAAQAAGAMPAAAHAPASSTPETPAPSTGTPTVRSNPKRSGTTRAGVAGLAALGGGVATALALWLFDEPTAAPVLRFEIPFSLEEAPATAEAIRSAGVLAAGSSFTAGNTLSLSADGSRLVYLRLEDSDTRLWSRALTAWSGRPIAGTTGASRGFLSPDGRALGFFTAPPSMQLRRVPADGGPPRTLADSVFDEAGGSWGTDGFIYYVGRAGDLRRVPEEGGPESVLLAPREHPWATGFAHPDALPGGRGLLVTVQAGLGSTDAPSDSIAVLDRESGELRTLMRGIEAAFLHPGYVVAVNASGTVSAAPFDVDRLRLTGPVVPILQGIPVSGRYTNVTFSRDGLVVYEAYRALEAEPVWVGRDGTSEAVEEGWSLGTGQVETLDLSPDGREILMAMRSPEGMEEVWVKELDGPMRKLPFPRSAGRPTWSPSGDSLLFLSEPESGGTYDVWRRSADGTGAPESVLDLDTSVAEARWSPDGTFVVRTSFRPSADIYRVVPNDTGPDLHPIADSPYVEATPDLSPDGRLLAYTSTESGRPEVYVRSYPEADRTYRISVDGGYEPRWSPGGRELFYKDPAGALISARIGGDQAFGVESRSPLFRLPPGDTPSLAAITYDVTAAGDRFLMLRRVDDAAGSGGRQYRAVGNLTLEIRSRLEAQRGG